jgi:hypothetical protein
MAKGFKTGGRQKGSPNKIKAVSSGMDEAINEAFEVASASDETPLQYMLRIMRDSRAAVGRRDNMAKAAAQYLHPKLVSTETKDITEKPQTVEDAWSRVFAQINKMGLRPEDVFQRQGVVVDEERGTAH